MSSTLRRHKYGVQPKARRTWIDGTVFDSRGEMLRWGELLTLERLGDITHLERQVGFALEVPDCRTGGKKLIATYVADFRYRDEAGRVIVEDFKSAPTRTPEYRLKRKLMAALHGVEIVETGAGSRGACFLPARRL